MAKVKTVRTIQINLKADGSYTVIRLEKGDGPPAPERLEDWRSVVRALEWVKSEKQKEWEVEARSAGDDHLRLIKRALQSGGGVVNPVRYG